MFKSGLRFHFVIKQTGRDVEKYLCNTEVSEVITRNTEKESPCTLLVI